MIGRWLLNQAWAVALMICFSSSQSHRDKVLTDRVDSECPFIRTSVQQAQRVSVVERLQWISKSLSACLARGLLQVVLIYRVLAFGERRFKAVVIGDGGSELDVPSGLFGGNEGLDIYAAARSYGCLGRRP